MNPETIPNTLPYLQLGLSVIAVIAGGFTVSLVVRFRQLRSELASLENARR